MKDLFKRTGAYVPPRALPAFYNTLHKEVEVFQAPSHNRAVRMYNCGPTVYDRQHIGNLSMFVFTDALRRVLQYDGFDVKQVINITDFGHLSGDNEGDADEGEDRMTKGLKREGMKITMANMTKLAEQYAEVFIDDLRALNVPVDDIEFPRASHYIKAEIAMVQTLAEKGYAYETEQGVYFDTTRFADYGRLGGIDLKGQREGARVAVNSSKRHPNDFVLWKSDKKMGWDSPWGKGFPGWHIECSAMIRSVLGEQIDIHTGGIEHIPIHHNNEIAQSEAATGKKPLSRFWMHRAHIQIDGGKIAKSGGNAVYLSNVVEQGFHPLALRYLYLGAHYRTPANFSWAALQASQTAFAKLVAIPLHLKDLGIGAVPPEWQRKFMERINDDLDTPGALAVVWEMVKDASLAPQDLLAGLLDFDRVLGLNLADPDGAARELGMAELKEEVAVDTLPNEVQLTVAEREEARSNKSWDRADALRAKLDELGYTVEDGANGPKIFKK